jgi:hypothetical protein
MKLSIGIVIVVLVVFFLLTRTGKKKRFVAVASACGDMTGIAEICKKYSIELLIYDKCGSCENAPECATCKVRENVGREQETFLHYVIDNYDDLPDKILFVALPLSKYERGKRIVDLIKNNTMGCFQDLSGYEDFTIDEWQGVNQFPARIRPFKAWYETFIGPWDSSAITFCTNGIMLTTRQGILKKPKSY